MLVWIGGGQLAKMGIDKAKELGVETGVWADKDDSPALHHAGIRVFRGPFNDPQVCESVARHATVAIIESENIPVVTLDIMARCGVSVSPTPTFLKYAQDRWEEKNLARRLGIETTDYVHISGFGCSIDEARERELKAHLPGFLKTRCNGFDGRSQRSVTTITELKTAFIALGGVPCILEKSVDYVCELSCAGVRTRKGIPFFFPVVKNQHQNGVLIKTVYRPRLFSPEIEEAARSAVWKIMEFANHWGIFVVEFFLTKDGRLLFNELAPRPHNSMHWTMHGCRTSQFEQLVRVAADLPPGSVDPVGLPVIMLNLFGRDVEKAECYRRVGWEVEDYGKRDLVKDRKTGHRTRVVRCAA